MTTIKHLNIPEPCSQNWEEMNPDANGRDCDHCAKTVVDFTRMSANEILEFITGRGNICGRFNQFQIDSVNDKFNQSQKSISFWRKGLTAAALVGILSSVKAEAKPLYYSVEQAPAQLKDTSVEMMGKVEIAAANHLLIEGTVIGGDNNLPIEGATVKIKGTNFGVMTDAKGGFTITLNYSAGQTLVITAFGFATREITVSQNAEKKQVILMKPSSMLMGEIVVAGPPVRYSFVKRVYRRFIRRPFRKVFH